MRSVYCVPLVLVSLATPAVFAEVANFSLFRIPELPNGLVVRGITNSGIVYGDAATPGQRKGFLLKNGAFTFFEAPNAQTTQIFGANDAGDFIGTGFTANSPIIAFLVRSGVLTILPSPPPGFGSFGFSGINNRGVIIGGSFSGGHRHGFILKNGSYTSIDAPGCFNTTFHAITSNEEIAGTCDAQSFIYKNGAFRFFQYPGASQTDIRGINDHGDMVGLAIFPSGHVPEFTYWVLRKGTFETPEVFGLFTSVSGISNSGQIAGAYHIADPVTHVVLKSYGFIQ